MGDAEMEFVTLKEAIDEVERILVKKPKTKKDIELARQWIRSAREFLVFDRKGLAGPPVICPDTVEMYGDGTVSCMESRKVLSASMGEPAGSGRKFSGGLTYDDQVVFCERCQKACADTLSRLEEELKDLK